MNVVSLLFALLLMKPEDTVEFHLLLERIYEWLLVAAGWYALV